MSRYKHGRAFAYCHHGVVFSLLETSEPTTFSPAIIILALNLRLFVQHVTLCVIQELQSSNLGPSETVVKSPLTLRICPLQLSFVLSVIRRSVLSSLIFY